LVRVLHVIATLDPSGAESQMVQLCCRLDRGAFAPTVCALTRGGPLEQNLRRADVPVHILQKRGRWDIGVVVRLVRLMRALRPHVVHTWLPTSNLLGTLAATIARVPVRITSERASDIWKGHVWRCADRMLNPLIHRVITNADAVRNHLLSHGATPNRKIVVIRNGLDIGEFDEASKRPPEPPLPTPRNRLVIGAVGRLEPQKGMRYLIEAFSLLPDDLPPTDLWIAGGGCEADALRKQVAALGIEPRVTFLGSRRDVPAILRHVDVFAMPSLWEGLPNAVLEAMAAGRPVVATSVDGTPEAVEHARTGLLVPPADPPALVNAMATLLRDAALRTEYGSAGRVKVDRDFSMERMVKETSGVYRNTIEATCEGK